MVREWSRVVISLLVLPVVVTIAAIISSDPALILGIIFPLVFIAILLSLDKKAVLQITISQLSSDVLRVGEELKLEANVSIPQGFGLIVFRFPTSERFEITDGTNVHTVFKGLQPIERKYSYRLKALRRGNFQFSNIQYTYYPALGLLNKSEGIVPVNMTIKVLPNIRILKKSQIRTRSRYQVPRQSRTRLGPYSTDFVSIRDYAVGDPYKFVNWKASSRLTNQDKLLVNEYEREGLRTFIFILDRGELMTHGTGEENPLEYGIAFLLSYAKLLLGHSINVGVWIVPQAGEKRSRNFVLPSSGTEHYQRIKEMLMIAEPVTAESPLRLASQSYAVLPEYEQHEVLIKIIKESRPTIVIISNVTSSNLNQLKRFANMLLRLRARVSLVDVMPYSIIAKHGSMNTGLPLKSILLPMKKKEQYGLLPQAVSIVSWDPAFESIGKAVRSSLVATRLNL